jgi:hypothetical protein
MQVQEWARYINASIVRGGKVTKMQAYIGVWVALMQVLEWTSYKNASIVKGAKVTKNASIFGCGLH